MGADLDFTILHKRGILKSASHHEEKASPDVLDLTALTPTFQSLPVPQTQPSSESSSAYDFLSGFAPAATESTPTPAHSHTADADIHGKLDTILAKLEDTMYKIETLSSRIARLESS